MEKYQVIAPSRKLLTLFILVIIASFAFALGLLYSQRAEAAEKGKKATSSADTKVMYPKNTELDFEGTQIEGEIRNPGEFYFQHREAEKFDSLVKRRKNFHREMLRDAVLSK